MKNQIIMTFLDVMDEAMSIVQVEYRFKFCNRIKLVCFLKFIVYEINSKMIKSGMVVLIEREKADADVTMG
jgi:hypothetical protein